MQSGFGFRFFNAFLLLLCMLQQSTSLKCFSCNSKYDVQCRDHFYPNYTSSATFKVVDCSDEISTKYVIQHLSKLLNALGVSVNLDPDYDLKLKDRDRPSACQKLEIDDMGRRVTVRECTFDSESICDSLRNKYRPNSDVSILYCGQCTDDYCNSSIKLYVPWNLLVIIFLANIII